MMIEYPARVETIAAPVRKLVVKSLRDAIIAGRIPPGHRLVEKELCDSLGVSRPSVREALRELEMEGLIESVPNRGPVVTEMTVETAVSIYQVRAALEALAARLFAMSADDTKLAELSVAAATLREAYEAGDVEEILLAKSKFYETLWQGGGNSVIPAILRNMNARINRLRRMTLSSEARRAESIKEISAILDALKRRDPEAAFEASRRHVEEAAKTAIDSVVRAGVQQ